MDKDYELLSEGDVMSSRREDTLTTITTAFKTIIAGATYRTSPDVVNFVDDIERVNVFPTLEIILGDSTTQADNDAATAFKETITVLVFGYVKADTDTSENTNLMTAAEALIHDCKKLIASIFTSNLEGVANRFNIAWSKTIDTTPVFLIGENKGMFQIKFTVIIRSLASTF